MVYQRSLEKSGQLFVLRPNCSATWPQNKQLFTVIAVFGLVIGVAFSLLGFWLVLPFVGLEVLLFGFCLWMSACDCHVMEVISISHHSVAIEKSGTQRLRYWKFNRAWAQIRLEDAPIRQHPSRLLIGSHGKLVHCGGFLTEQERRLLAKNLKTAMPITVSVS